MNKLKRYVEGAQKRASRRRSPWNLILIPFVIVFSVLAYGGQLRLLWMINIVFYPEHVGRFQEFWRGSVGLSGFLLVFPVLFSSMILGMMSANILSWCILPVRRIFDREAGGDKRLSFVGSLKGLGRIALVLVPLCLLLGFIGAITLKSLK